VEVNIEPRALSSAYPQSVFVSVFPFLTINSYYFPEYHYLLVRIMETDCILCDIGN